MFRLWLRKELRERVGNRIEVTTDNNMVDGLLVEVAKEYIVIEIDDSYSDGNLLYIVIREINNVWDPAVS
ncbi:DUF2642 domain-containing protein [Geomicrobium sp. JCM 19039]|uniref:DUF2642 domain-containing protein n=1 Tax=Geomicrobium sp. JCM 19039 TaxID=1460636 RepID=UPI00045F2BCE|nr:DUF2642 domain-containing protein [Geomicrobium sp. JCM 19039]GAK12140.1 hypothetical protein JCM19039_1880 [Geomicrobium sp. JCM 19039]